MRRWWDERPLPDDSELEARIGQLCLRVAREGQLARLAWHHDEGEETNEPVIGEPAAVRKPEADWTVVRYATGGGKGGLVFAPKLAPLPVVARPEVPFTVAPGRSVEVFVSTPLWLEVRVGDDVLDELAAVPPKDTWFGTSTEGEHCLAMRTHLRMLLANVVLRQHRAVAPVTIRNRGKDPLQIERVRLPVPSLSLSVDDGGRLWTQPIELLRDEGQETAELKVSPHLRGTQIAVPRERSGANPVMRVFNSVFG